MSHKDETIKAIEAANKRQGVADLRAVLSTPAGRRVYVHIIEQSGLYGTPPLCEPERSEWMGRRAFGLEIRNACLTADLNGCHTAEQELEAARNADQQRIRLAEAEDLKTKNRS